MLIIVNPILKVKPKTNFIEPDALGIYCHGKIQSESFPIDTLGVIVYMILIPGYIIQSVERCIWKIIGTMNTIDLSSYNTYWTM